jgi:hypothetical protein
VYSLGLLSRSFIAVLWACASEGPPSPAVPSAFTIVSGQGQVDTIGATLAESLVVRVSAASGEGIAMVPVAWRAEGGYVYPETTATDAGGIARSRWTLGLELGPERVIAGVPGVVLSDTFTATAQPGRAVRMVVVRQGPPWIVPPDSVSIVASAYDRLGNVARNVQWSSSDPLVARADSAPAHPPGAPGEVFGIVHAVGPGRAYVVAQSGSARDSVGVIVVRDTAVYGDYDLARRDSIAYPYCDYPSQVEVDCFSGSLAIDGVGGFVAKSFVVVTLIPLNQTLTDSALTTGTYQPISTCELQLVSSAEPNGHGLKSGASLSVTTDPTASTQHAWVYRALTRPQTCP